MAEQIERQHAALTAVTDTLSATVAALGDDASVTVSDMQYFAVSFGAEAIGMIVVIKPEGVMVGELRSGPDGEPLAARASGRIMEGDHVVAVNERCLLPLTSLEEVSKQFSEASRPVRVLFRRPQRSVEV